MREKQQNSQTHTVLGDVFYLSKHSLTHTHTTRYLHFIFFFSEDNVANCTDELKVSVGKFSRIQYMEFRSYVTREERRTLETAVYLSAFISHFCRVFYVATAAPEHTKNSSVTSLKHSCPPTTHWFHFQE